MKDDTEDSAVLGAIMEAAVDAMIVSDESGRILRANPAAEKLFCYDLGEMLGQNVNMLMPDVISADHDDFMSRYRQTGEKRIIGLGRDLEGRRKDNSVFPLHLSIGEAQVHGKQIFVAIMHDLQYRRAAQDALSRSQRLDAVGQLTGGIAHDFNNLLTVIVGNLELLDLRILDERHRALIRDALDSAELGADLTSRLMAFARQSNLRPIEANLADLCNDTLAILRRTLGATYRIKTDFAADIDTVMIDPVQLQSALINLALNARDAMTRGGELLISVQNVAIDDGYMAQETDIQSGHYVRISVSDDGEGMTPEAQTRAFEPFFTTKGESGGTGLGLATVYGFVRQSGGHITLYSEPGHGTSFGLYFPALPQSEPHPAQAHPDSRRAVLPKGSGQTVLVVEDNAKVRALSVERLRDLGYRTEEAENGDAAYSLLNAGLKVDVVFSDLVMPGELNGYDLASKVAMDFPSIKILLTSGYASDVVTGRMERDRSYDVLHKPYHISDLAARLQTLLASC